MEPALGSHAIPTVPLTPNVLYGSTNQSRLVENDVHAAVGGESVQADETQAAASKLASHINYSVDATLATTGVTSSGSARTPTPHHVQAGTMGASSGGNVASVQLTLDLNGNDNGAIYIGGSAPMTNISSNLSGKLPAETNNHYDVGIPRSKGAAALELIESNAEYSFIEEDCC